MLTMLKCSNAGCDAVFETSAAISPNTKFSCKLHTRPTGKDERFQGTQFDKEMRRAAHPVGTNHISNQGSDIVDSNDFGQEALRDRLVFLSEVKDGK